MSKDTYIFLSYTLNKSSVSDYFTALSNQFSNEGYKVVVFTKRASSNHNLGKDVIVKIWPSKRNASFRNFLLLYKTMKRVKPVMTISVFGFVTLFLITGFLLKVPNRIAWIRSISTAFPIKKWRVLRKEIVYKFATLIVTNSEATKEDAIKTFNIKSSKIRVLPNSVKKYDEIDSNLTDKSNILYVGRLYPSKGVDVLVLAMELLIKKGYNIYLDIIGEGKLKPKLEELIQNLQLSKSINFLGLKSKPEVLKAFRKSYCSVIPSNSEAFGFTVIEAMSMSTAVIGANNTGIKEIILNNTSGLLFETGNHLDLADKIELLILNEKMRNELAQNGYQRFLDFYENEFAIERDVQFLKRNYL